MGTGRAEGYAVGQRVTYRRVDDRVGVTIEASGKIAGIVAVLVAVQIPHIGAFAARHGERVGGVIHAGAGVAAGQAFAGARILRRAFRVGRGEAFLGGLIGPVQIDIASPVRGNTAGHLAFLSSLR